MKKLSYLIAGLLLLPGMTVAQSSDPELILVPVVDFSEDAPAAFAGDEPVAITHAGDGRLFITTQQGRIWILDGGALLATPFLDIDSLVACCGERGLLSVAFHPDYPNTPYFFVNYTDNAGDTVIARYQVSGNPNLADAGSGIVLLPIDQDSSNHNGGQLQFGPDGYLYVGMGDGGGSNDQNCRAQEENTLLGKMLRLNIDVGAPNFYGPAPDNPFIGLGFPMNHVWAKGLRNPWRFSFDRLTGDLYIGDVGQGQREEIDVVPFPDSGGQNYGWVRMEGTRCNDSSFPTTCNTVVVPACGDPSFTDPIPELEYTHADGCSVTGGYVYRGDRISPLQSWYVYGDYCSGTVWAAVDDGGWVVNVLTNVATFNLSTFGEDNDGELYAGLLNGTVFRFDTTNPGFIFADGFETL